MDQIKGLLVSLRLGLDLVRNTKDPLVCDFLVKTVEPQNPVFRTDFAFSGFAENQETRKQRDKSGALSVLQATDSVSSSRH